MTPTLSAAEVAYRDAIRPYLNTDDPLLLRPVMIRDTARERPWGSGPVNPVTRMVRMAAVCMRCLITGNGVTVRGEPRGDRACEDGAYYWVQRWSNECGHIDDYRLIAVEGDTIAAALDQGMWVRQYPTEAEAKAAATAWAAQLEGARVDVRTGMPHELGTDVIMRVAHTLNENRVAMAGVVALDGFSTRQVVFTGANRRPVVYLWQPRPEAVPDAGE